jgi:SOS-response transcriptional repressor LexA
MLQLQIDDDLYSIRPDADNGMEPMTEAQRALHAILCTLATIEVPRQVRGEVLQELLGLMNKSAYESRLTHLIQKGYVERVTTGPLPQHLEQTYQTIKSLTQEGTIQVSLRQMMDAMNIKSPIVLQNRLAYLKKKGYLAY